VPKASQVKPASAPRAEQAKEAAAAPRAPTPAPRADQANDTPADVPIADPKAMLSRLRNAREQRERHQPAARERVAKNLNEPVEQRFAPGDQVRCPPFGDGVVRESRVEKGREILIVDFPNVDNMRIDTTTRHVRRLDDDAEGPVDDDYPL
jgi:hypothetical protein